jgi:putative nucleotidyltransferase with HDIG domain
VNAVDAAMFLLHHPVVERVTAELRAAGVPEAYLVGGAVRDAMRGLGQETRDLDVALPTDQGVAMEALAGSFGGAVVPLDDATTRLVFHHEVGGSWRVDVARYRGPTIEDDLRLRDFTVDAMAVPLLGGGPPTVLDPTGGKGDVGLRLVRHAYPAAFKDDPLRTLRAVRLAAALEGSIAPETQPLVRQAAPGLAQVAGERVRDELMRIFGARDVALWANELDGLGLLAVLVPASEAMHDVPPSPPHRFGLWEHSTRAVRLLEGLMDDPAAFFEAEAAEITERVGSAVEGEITYRSLMLLLALLHDVGKPGTRTVDTEGRVRFLGHEEAGAAILADLAGRLRLGRRAGEYVDRMERAHMRPIWLAAEPVVTPRARYRFFRDVGPVALDVLLHSVADVRATVGDDDPAWQSHLAFVREMLAFRRGRPRPIERAALLSGNDIMEIVGIGPGPLVGYILERLAEAAAVGPLRSRAECEDLVRREIALWRHEFELREGR